MKTLITNYSFNASAKTITFNGYSSISLDSILLITNVTDNVIIYNFADPALGGTVVNNVLTLTYNTANGTMFNTDRLQIYYDDPAIQPANTTKQQDISDLVEVLYYLTNQLEFLAGVRVNGTNLGGSGAQQGLQVYFNSGSSMSTVSSVGTLNGLTNIGNTGTGTQGLTIDPGFIPTALMKATAIQSNINNVVVT